MSRHPVGLFILLIVLILTGPVFAQAETETKQNQTNMGKTVFMTNCTACHGVKGDGKGPASAAIKDRPPRDLTEGKFLYGDSDEALFKTISDGIANTSMPPWKTLPEIERRAVIQYIRTLKKKSI